MTPGTNERCRFAILFEKSLLLAFPNSLVVMQPRCTESAQQIIYLQHRKDDGKVLQIKGVCYQLIDIELTRAGNSGEGSNG